MFGEVVAEEEGFEEIEDEFSRLGSKSIDWKEKLDVLEDIRAGEELLLSLYLFPKVINSLKLIDTV